MQVNVVSIIFRNLFFNWQEFRIFFSHTQNNTLGLLTTQVGAGTTELGEKEVPILGCPTLH